jgi:hypothetical protein
VCVAILNKKNGSFSKTEGKRRNRSCLVVGTSGTGGGYKKRVLEGEKEMNNDGGMNSSIIYCKNFCKCHNVPPVQH